jgi:hypothetical protein
MASITDLIQDTLLHNPALKREIERRNIERQEIMSRSIWTVIPGLYKPAPEIHPAPPPQPQGPSYIERGALQGQLLEEIRQQRELLSSATEDLEAAEETYRRCLDARNGAARMVNVLLMRLSQI